jgi:peptidoglycan/LPS O-acetylase OafA/YrhL
VQDRARPAFTKRLAGIEGLRGLAAASVIGTHVWSRSTNSGGFDIGWPGTYVFPKLGHGVTLFFALSGFLLYLPFATAALRNESRPSFSAYLRNRALRILPAYWCILLLTALVLQSARIQEGRNFGIGAITDPWLLLKDALLVQNYDRSTLSTGISPSWSLAIEVVFYLSLPLLVLGGTWLASASSSRRRRRMMLLMPAVLLAVLGLLGSAAGIRIGSQVWTYSFLSYAHLFAVGMALAVLRVDYQDELLRLPRFWRGGVLAAMVVVGGCAIKLGAEGRIPDRAEIALMSIACGLLLALVALPADTRRSPLIRVLESTPLVGAGLVSYSVYLWHMPVLLFLRKHGLTVEGGAGALALNLFSVAVATYALSWLTYRYVEKPALRWKARRRVPPAPDSGLPLAAPTAVASASVGARRR